MDVLRSPRSAAAGRAQAIIVFAHRNPMLLLRFVGSLLLRSAQRRFVVSLFHEPPRNTRFGWFGPPPLPPRHEAGQDRASQYITIPKLRMRYPTADGAIQGRILEVSSFDGFYLFARSPHEAANACAEKQTMLREHAKSKEWNAVFRVNDAAFLGMEKKPQIREPGTKSASPCAQLLAIIGKKEHIIHVAYVALNVHLALDDGIYMPEIYVREKLARQVPDRYAPRP